MFMANKRILILLISLLVSLYTGCAGLGGSKTDWTNLKDRKFFLTEFQYIHTGKNKKDAYDVMCNFPVKKIMYILSKEYNIEIDMSDFYRFIKTGNSNEIKAEGFVRYEKFTWKSANSDAENKISIIFEKDYFDESKMKFALNTFFDNKKMKSFQLDFSKLDFLFKQMYFYISKTDEYTNEFDKNDYEAKEQVPGLILGVPGSRKLAEVEKKDEIKAILDEYVKSLNPDQKKAFKHEIIDHIYKICE